MGLLDDLNGKARRLAGLLASAAETGSNYYQSAHAPASPETAKMVAGLLPVVSDAISGYDALNSAYHGKYGEAALNGVGVLPFIPALGGMIKQTGNLGKSGLPSWIKKSPGPLPEAIDTNKLKGVSNSDIYGNVWPSNAEGLLSIKPIDGGDYVMTAGGTSHISKVKPFYAVGDDAEELAQYGIDRLQKSTKSIQSARTAKIPKEVRDSLEKQFGKNFSYDISNAERSGSYYITHKPSGTKIRVSDHDLPNHYENTADIDLRNHEVSDIAARLAELIGK